MGIANVYPPVCARLCAMEDTGTKASLYPRESRKEGIYLSD